MRNTVIATLVVALLWTSSAQSAYEPQPGPTGGDWLSSWSCETTYVEGNDISEQDTMERIGLWLHGTARPGADSSSTSPFYDYYVGYDPANKKSVYIEIDPFEGGKYFVGTSRAHFDSHNLASLNHSYWNIEYPSAQGSYRFDETRSRFTIQYANLTQLCSRTTQQPNPSTQSLQMSCTIRDTSSLAPLGDVTTTLTITRMRPNGAQLTRGDRWWQGVGRSADGTVIYEYNIFLSSSGAWVAVAINGMTGDYFIATSYKSPNVGNTTWTIVYPRLEDGFSFLHVSSWQNALPQGFDLIFSDGVEHCER